MERILIIGQGPSKDGAGKSPLDGSGSGDRLAELAGLPRVEMLKRCTAINLLNEYYGKNGKGDKFPMDVAKKSAETLRVTWDNFDRVLLLGDNVAQAFGYYGENLMWIQPRDGSRVEFAVVPHPSGINKWFNKKENAEAARRFLTATFFEAPEEIEVPASGRAARAAYCTNYLKTFDKNFDWVEIALIIMEAERDELYLEVGQKTLDAWMRFAAPRSYRLCYMAKSRYKALKEAFSLEEMKRIPSETAEWASKARNISPAVLSKPEVKEALMFPKQKAVKILKEKLPDEHIEDVKKLTCRLGVSQYEAVTEGHEAFKRFKDEKASFEDFLEWLVSEFMESPHPDGGSFREQWEKVKA